MKLISIGFFLDDKAPVIWRGPMVMGAVRQFLKDTLWGTQDFLIVDLPPGTGDAQLTLAQQVSLDGVVIVTTPQDVALLDATARGPDVSAGALPDARNRREHELLRVSRLRRARRAVRPRRRRADGAEEGTQVLARIPIYPEVREARRSRHADRDRAIPQHPGEPGVPRTCAKHEVRRRRCPSSRSISVQSYARRGRSVIIIAEEVGLLNVHADNRRMHQLRRVRAANAPTPRSTKAARSGNSTARPAPRSTQDIYYIVPDKCTECVGFFDQEQCAAVCPVDCCIPDPNIPETEEVLHRARPRCSILRSRCTSEFPSRFRQSSPTSLIKSLR